jgi:tetratricopeptide (TPR) repeat protein
LAVAIPVTLVLWLAALFLIRPAFVTSVAERPYERGDYAEAAAVDDWLKPLNVLEPWKYWFNHGTAWAQDGRYDDAIAEFETAFSVTLSRDAHCVIANNLAVTEEAAGDAAADPAVASAYYEAALQVLDEYAHCWDGDEAATRVQRKLQDTSPGQGEDESDQAEGEGNPDPAGTQQDQLEAKEQQAAQDHQSAVGTGQGAAGTTSTTENRW